MGKQFVNIVDFLADSSFRHWVLHEKEIPSLYWEAWVKANPDKADVLHEAKELVWAMEGNTPEFEEESEHRIWDTINATMGDLSFSEEGDAMESESLQVPYITKSSRSMLSYPIFRIAMILIISAGTAIILSHLNEHFFAPPNELSEINLETWITKTAKKGEKKKIQLPDGSTVTMNSESELSFKSGFGQQHRELILIGEAYFEVSPDSLLPFTVQSKNLQVRALGTSFTVSSFADKIKQEVKLFTGKVSVERQNEEGDLIHAMSLTPGEEALLNNDEFEKVLFDRRKALLWTKGILYFDGTPLEEVLEILERWYGVDITVSGQGTSTNKVSGEFRKDNLENVLSSISYSSAFEFHIKDKKVMIEMK